MTAEKHEGETHPAYLCGRLLALFDKIYMEAHAKRDDNGRIVSTPSSSPANRFYGSASKTPALILPQMCDRARNHLDKLATNQKTKFRAFQLEYGVPEDRRSDDVPEDFEGLAAVVARLKETSGGNFPRILSLEEQGRFAIGFYYERCRQWPNFKKDKKELTEPDNQQE